MTLRWCTEANILTSFKALSFSFYVKFPNFTFFTAYSIPSTSLFALYTQEKAPYPSLDKIWKSFKDIGLQLNLHYLKPSSSLIYVIINILSYGRQKEQGSTNRRTRRDYSRRLCCIDGWARGWTQLSRLFYRRPFWKLHIRRGGPPPNFQDSSK